MMTSNLYSEISIPQPRKVIYLLTAEAQNTRAQTITIKMPIMLITRIKCLGIVRSYLNWENISKKRILFRSILFSPTPHTAQIIMSIIRIIKFSIRNLWRINTAINKQSYKTIQTNLKKLIWSIIWWTL